MADHAFLHLSFNAGSLGSTENGRSLSDENRRVRQNVYDRIKELKTTTGRYPDAVAVQECGGFDFELAPRFGLPCATDISVRVPRKDDPQSNVRRGVCTYADAEACHILSPIDSKCEIVTTIHDYTDYVRGKGKRDKRVAFINVYKLNNAHAETASSEEIRNYILQQKARLDRLGVRDIVCHGDFNDEDFDLGCTFRQLSDHRLSHRNKPGDRATRIDKVFTTCKTAKLVEVLDTVENKSNDCGHKCLVITIGSRKGGGEPKTVISMKKFKKIVKKFKGGYR